MLRSKLIVLAAVLLTTAVAFAESSDERKAREAAEAWLELVDKGDYAASWEQAAAGFKQQVSQRQWQGAIGQARGQFGELKSRSFAAAQYTNSLPRAPDGDYVVIQYRTSFSKKASAIETITPALDEDGVWRVSGYYIK